MSESEMERREQHKATFREEAYELLCELEESLLELEDHKGDIDIISRVFRALHTIKGSGAMFGFDEIATFVHDVENVYDMIRNGEMAVTKEIIDLTLLAADHVRKNLDASINDEGVDEGEGAAIILAFRKILAKTARGPELAGHADAPQKPREATSIVVGPSAMADAAQSDGEAFSEESTYRITFVPPRDILRFGTNPLHIIDDLRAMGRCYVIAHLEDIPSLDEIDPEACYTHWNILLTTRKSKNAVRDVFIFVEDESDLTIEVIDEAGAFLEESSYKRLGEILIERGDLTRADIDSVVGSQKRIGEMLVESGLVECRDVESALAEQELIKEERDKRYARDASSTIRVASAKLDKLVDLVGELVTVQARLSQLSGTRTDAALLGVAEDVEHLTSELHDTAMSIRMVPIGTTYSKFRRLVRDLSDGLGRNVRMVTSGAETELDKTVIERLNDPLVHLIRNCIDHGIEPPEVRDAAGKPAQGTIHISAVHSGSDVLIQIRDDGAGLDRDAIRAKCVERGLLGHDEDVTDSELLQHIFAPGFSTAKKITDVSGRGVGMDVVKRSIESLRGSVEVASEKGIGTTITLRIPLTLAIIEGLLVKIGDEYFVLPLTSVEECVELGAGAVGRGASERHLVNVRGEMIPYIRLKERFGINGGRVPLEQVVIINSEAHRFGFVVDKVIGEHQTVIKSLSRVYRHVSGISGATILGNGSIALILDVPRLYEDAEIDERTMTGAD